MDGDCPKHSGQSALENRKPYDEIMAALPRNQSGEGLARHACAICAYERGRQDARRDARKEIAEHIARCLNEWR